MQVLHAPGDPGEVVMIPDDRSLTCMSAIQQYVSSMDHLLCLCQVIKGIEKETCG